MYVCVATSNFKLLCRKSKLFTDPEDKLVRHCQAACQPRWTLSLGIFENSGHSHSSHFQKDHSHSMLIPMSHSSGNPMGPTGSEGIPTSCSPLRQRSACAVLRILRVLNAMTWYDVTFVYFLVCGCRLQRLLLTISVGSVARFDVVTFLFFRV